jgi:hypothetical protein
VFSSHNKSALSIRESVDILTVGMPARVGEADRRLRSTNTGVEEEPAISPSAEMGEDGGKAAQWQKEEINSLC